MLQNPTAVPFDLRTDAMYVEMIRSLSGIRLWDDGKTTAADRFHTMMCPVWWAEFARLLREAAPEQIIPHIHWRFLLLGDFYEMWIRPYLGRSTDFWDFLIREGRDRHGIAA